MRTRTVSLAALVAAIVVPGFVLVGGSAQEERPHFEETSLPISQIAIELYQPITGGLYFGGRFAPEGVKVAGMHDYTPPKEN